ncbi:uncharacterized protein LOC132924491 [Rhopalosiphum padi]|uniref:uncharacterized protein LOC132924491 n=1 Tax=Rhopalosiphum padi TaxID=40932 RepID=UPI00298D6E01|nr:uncharacterized protein LOC132924491 [Rhopalosiphum padi]
MMARTIREMMAVFSAALLMVEGTTENATDDGVNSAAEGNLYRDARQAEQRDQRCALPSFIGGGMSSGEADTVLESTRTVDRYLVKPAAYYENRVTYREKPVAANVLRRRRPVPVQRVGLLPYYVRRVDFADGGRRPPDDGTAVSMTADDVRRVLQRVYSEGMIAGGEAATTGTNFNSKVLPLKG